MQQFMVRNHQQVKSCGICSHHDHPMDMCSTLQDEEHLNAIQGHQGQQYQRKYDPFSATYNSGWRDHPNFSWSQNNIAPQAIPNNMVRQGTPRFQPPQ